MFFKRIFGRKKIPEPARSEKLSIDSLEERANKLKKEKLAETRSKLNPMLDGISEERKAILGELKTLSEAEPSEEAHPGLKKTALEARRLLADKLTRALVEIRLEGEPSTSDLMTLEGRLAKMVNLMSDAVTTHSRYVRALFALHLRSIELHMRKMHEFAMGVHTLVESTTKGMHSLDSILSKISLEREIRLRIETSRTNARSLEGQVAELERSIGKESGELARLVESEEFKGLSASERELEQIGREMVEVKGAASSAISALGRPLRKMEKLVAVGECQIDREAREALKLCIEDPSEVLSPNVELSAIEMLLRRMVELLEEGKISMGDRERRKRIELARGILEERRLPKLRESLDRLKARMETKKRTRELTLLLDQKAELERSIEKHRSDIKRAQTTIGELHRESERAEKEIGKNLAELQRLASEVMGAKIELTTFSS